MSVATRLPERLFAGEIIECTSPGLRGLPAGRAEDLITSGEGDGPEERLGALARSILRDVFGSGASPSAEVAEVHDAYRRRAARLSNAEFRVRLAEARRRLAQLEPHVVQDALRCLLLRAGWTEEHGPLRVDRPRLRGVHPGAHRDPRAAAAYALHRDTWYANPQRQINLWIALHPVAATEAVRFYPARFGSAVPNNSAAFDYLEFARLAGFQSDVSAPGLVYPAARETTDARQAFGSPMGVTLPQDGLLMFSAAHLHDTAPLDGTLARFSLDVRVVPGESCAPGAGAPNHDNNSRGDASTDYPHWVDWAPARREATP